MSGIIGVTGSLILGSGLAEKAVNDLAQALGVELPGNDRSLMRIALGGLLIFIAAVIFIVSVLAVSLKAIKATDEDGA